MKAPASILALVLFCLGGSPLEAQKPEIPVVTTMGQAEIKVVPDLADMRFDVEVRNVDLTAARKQHSDRMKKLIATIRAAGVVETDIQTSQVQLVPFYQREENTRAETEVIQFFSVSQSVYFTLKDIKKVTEITATAITAGSSRVGEVRLRTSQLRKHRDQARLMAVRAAREKAIALATELGSKVGKPHAIVEQSFGEYPIAFGNATQNVAQGIGGNPEAGAGGGAFEPGTISIKADIQVSFVLE